MRWDKLNELKQKVEVLTSSDVTGNTGSNNIVRSVSNINNSKQSPPVK